MFGLMREPEFDDNGVSEIIAPENGAPFVIRRVEASNVVDPLLLSFLSKDASEEAYFLQSLDGEILTPLMTGHGIMLCVYAKTRGTVE